MAKDYKIKDFLKRIKNTIEIKDGVLYKRVTVSGNHKGVSLRDKIDGSKIGTKKQFTISGGDFILSKIDARNGAFGIIPVELDGAIITGNFWTYKVDTELVDTEWFFYFTHSFNFIQICIESSTGSTHRKYLDEKVFLNHDIVLPSKSEQLTMVEKYKEQSTISSNLKKEIEFQKRTLSKLKQSILQEAIQGKLTEDWRKENPKIEPASELLKRIKAEKAQLIKEKKIKKEKPLSKISDEEIPFELSENWVWCRIGEISFIGTGATPLTTNKNYYNNGNIPWITSSATGDLFVDKPEKFITEKALKETNCTLNPIGTLVIAMYGQGKTRGQITELMFESATNQACATILPFLDRIEIRRFIKLYFRNIYLEIRKLAQGGAQPNLNMGKIKNTVIPLPPQEEQKVIVEKVETLMQKCQDLEHEIAKSETNAEMLMQAVLKEAFESKETKVIELPKLQELESSHFPKRKMLASYIINQSANDDKFGDTKFEKLLHLADYHILKRNFGQEYKQKAAGPYDNKFTVPFFIQTIKAGWFYKQSLGNMNRILPAKNNSKSQTTYDYFSEDELKRINALIETFKSFDYKIPEIISTLYAVWNNRIIKKQEISNELLKQDFLDWDKGKAQYVYPKDRVTPAIKWMKENGFVPDGWGKIIEPPKSKVKK